MHNVISRLIIASLLFANPAVAGELAVADAKKTKVESARQSRFTLFGWIETGITVNFASPEDHQNFGRLLDDRSNEPLLNQLMVGAERTLDPEMANRFDWAFKLELFYGSDARYLHSTGLLDLTTNDIVQPDLPEAWGTGAFPDRGKRRRSGSQGRQIHEPLRRGHERSANERFLFAQLYF